jgi:molybdate transport system substrate-binding protein
MRNLWRLALLIWLLVMATAVSAQETRSLTVFAAASLSDAFEALAAQFEADHPGVDVLFNFGASSSLAAQIVEGAPADVFASANETQMNTARTGGRITGQPRIFAQNRLVLIVPAHNPARITSLRDLARPGVQLMVAAPNVPARVYTGLLLERLAANPAYGESYREAVIANIVSEEPNVRLVSAKIALGEGDAGIVYVSDLTPDIRQAVIALPIPDSLNTVATYPIAVLDDSASPELAQAFVDFVVSDAGQDILASSNFLSVRTAPARPTEHRACAADG